MIKVRVSVRKMVMVDTTQNHKKITPPEIYHEVCMRHILLS